MSNVVNLNRFRKKKAQEEKQKRAEQNRRLHGRTKNERVRDELEKSRLEDKLNGAFLVREQVTMDDIPQGDEADAFVRLEALIQEATDNESDFKDNE